MHLNAIPMIIQEVFSAPKQDSRIIIKGNNVKVERRDEHTKKYRNVKSN